MMPNINSATARVLDAAGIQTLVADDAGCCGALRTPPERPRRRPGRHAPQHRRLVAAGRGPDRRQVEAIVMNASGCGVTVKEYGHALAHDPAYADKARRIAELTRDLSELLPDLVEPPRLALPARRGSGEGLRADARRRMERLAFHPPCTLQHGQQLRGGVETHLDALGFDVSIAASEATCAAARPAPTRCCSPSSPPRCATASSPISARWSRGHRLGQHRLHPASAERHDTPVRHWVEVLDDALGLNPGNPVDIGRRQRHSMTRRCVAPASAARARFSDAGPKGRTSCET